MIILTPKLFKSDHFIHTNLIFFHFQVENGEPRSTVFSSFFFSYYHIHKEPAAVFSCMNGDNMNGLSQTWYKKKLLELTQHLIFLLVNMNMAWFYE